MKNIIYIYINKPKNLTNIRLRQTCKPRSEVICPVLGLAGCRSRKNDLTLKLVQNECRYVQVISLDILRTPSRASLGTALWAFCAPLPELVDICSDDPHTQTYTQRDSRVPQRLLELPLILMIPDPVSCSCLCPAQDQTVSFALKGLRS